MNETNFHHVFCKHARRAINQARKLQANDPGNFSCRYETAAGHHCLSPNSAKRADIGYTGNSYPSRALANPQADTFTSRTFDMNYPITRARTYNSRRNSELFCNYAAKLWRASQRHN